MIKKPSNRYSLPKIIISKVDDISILEFKIKYEKLARLDIVEVKSVHYDNGEIVFDDVLINGGDLEVIYSDDKKEIRLEIEDKSYSIRGKRVGGKKRLLEDRISRTKVQLKLSDGIKDDNGNLRESLCEGELLCSKTPNIYSKILKREVKNSQEIYLIKRFLDYRSELLFFYAFVDNFFKTANNKYELWKIDFEKNPKLIEYFKFSINDKLKNRGGFLYDYHNDKESIKSDLSKIKENFSKLRHSLMHFDYDFFDKFFRGEDVGFDLDIKFLDEVIKNIDKLNIENKKEFIDDEKIRLFNYQLDFEKAYDIFAHTAINRVAFNSVINRLIIEDGIEKVELKEYFIEKSESKSFKIDIHQDREYKKLYIRHKELVTKASITTDSKAKAKINEDIHKIKTQMKNMTKTNSLNRLEFKLRLAFGFIYSEYRSYEEFKNSFDEDVKKGNFNSIGLDKSKSYVDKSFNTIQSGEKLEKISKDIESLSLERLIGEDRVLKSILFIFIFIPQELKGSFLGFIRGYYHDTKHIFKDIKGDKEFVDELSIGLRLKVLDKNIRSLSILKYSLASQTKYNNKDSNFYEDGNKFGKFFKNLSISHNQEEFVKSIYASVFSYYSSLYKLINDFEIYALNTLEPDKNLSDLTGENTPFSFNGHYNFTTLLNKLTSESPKALSKCEIVKSRNDISHLNMKKLFELEAPLSEKREKIVEFLDGFREDMKKSLGYDPLNDFLMRVIQTRKRVEVYSHKEQTIEDMIKRAKKPNDFYDLYKTKGVETVNSKIWELIGIIPTEEKICKKIAEGNGAKR